jgi:hypothetical protein
MPEMERSIFLSIFCHYGMTTMRLFFLTFYRAAPKESDFSTVIQMTRSLSSYLDTLGADNVLENLSLF